MPRGGPGAGLLSRWFDTDVPEYLDRDDVPEDWPARVVRGLDRLHRLLGTYRWLTRRVLAETAGLDAPHILELGAGSGGLSRRLLDAHPAARLTVSDVDERSVAALAASGLGSHPRAEVRRLDATAIDAPDSTFDLAVFAFSFHHLTPPLAVSVIREGCRVAGRLLVVDAWRGAIALLPVPLYLPLGGRAMVHDGVISARRMYSAAALRHLAAAAGPVSLQVRFQLPGFMIAAFGGPSPPSPSRRTA